MEAPGPPPPRASNRDRPPGPTARHHTGRDGGLPRLRSAATGGTLASWAALRGSRDGPVLRQRVFVSLLKLLARSARPVQEKDIELRSHPATPRLPENRGVPGFSPGSPSENPCKAGGSPSLHRAGALRAVHGPGPQASSAPAAARPAPAARAGRGASTPACLG